jgi:hypothetical protein
MTPQELLKGFVPMRVITHKEFLKEFAGIELTDEMIERAEFEKYLPKKKKRR